MAEGQRSRSRIVREVIEIQRNGGPPEIIEVKPGAPEMQGIDDLLRRLDNERENLRIEMDRIFGPIPPTKGQGIPPKLGEADKTSPDQQPATIPPFEREEAEGQESTPPGYGTEYPQYASPSQSAPPSGRGPQATEAPPESFRFPAEPGPTPPGYGRESPQFAAPTQSAPIPGRGPQPTEAPPESFRFPAEPGPTPPGYGRGSPQFAAPTQYAPPPGFRPHPTEAPWYASEPGPRRGAPPARPGHIPRRRSPEERSPGGRSPEGRSPGGRYPGGRSPAGRSPGGRMAPERPGPANVEQLRHRLEEMERRINRVEDALDTGNGLPHEPNAEYDGPLPTESGILNEDGNGDEIGDDIEEPLRNLRDVLQRLEDIVNRGMERIEEFLERCDMEKE